MQQGTIKELRQMHEPPFSLEFACFDCGKPVEVRYSEDEGGTMMTNEQLATIKYRADQLTQSGAKLVGFTGRYERGPERRLSVNITLERPSGERVHDQILVTQDGLLCTLLR